MARLCFRKKADKHVIAVQLDLDTPGFVYQKWGGEQKCKRGDWLLKNGTDVYTVDGEVFSRTYQRVSAGVFAKTARVWAEAALESGLVATLEGVSFYKVGDYLVCNNEDGTDAYCVGKDKFESMYELDS